MAEVDSTTLHGAAVTAHCWLSVCEIMPRTQEQDLWIMKATSCFGAALLLPASSCLPIPQQLLIHCRLLSDELVWVFSLIWQAVIITHPVVLAQQIGQQPVLWKNRAKGRKRAMTDGWGGNSTIWCGCWKSHLLSYEVIQDAWDGAVSGPCLPVLEQVL